MPRTNSRTERVPVPPSAAERREIGHRHLLLMRGERWASPPPAHERRPRIVLVPKNFACSGLLPFSRTECIALLKSCGSLKDLERGARLHIDISKKGLDQKDVFVASALVRMYAKCGRADRAREVFDSLELRDVVLWASLMTGYVEAGEDRAALDCLERARQDGISANAFILVCSLKACVNIADFEEMRTIHAEVIYKGLESELLVGSALVDVYVKCNMVKSAEHVFHRLPTRTIVAWTALMAGYVTNGNGEQALDCFDLMRLEGISPDVGSFICSAKACGAIGAHIKGHIVHTKVVMTGFERNYVLGSSLVTMYSKCGLFPEGECVLHKLVDRDTISWNALMAGYAEFGKSEKVLDCFIRMELDGIPPDSTSYVCGLKATGNQRSHVKGLNLHAEIVKNGFENEPFVENSLIDTYARCGFLKEAQKMFDKLQVHDTTTWTALMVGYREQGCDRKALDCLKVMQQSGFSFSDVTLVCSLKTCGNAGATQKGREIHSLVAKRGLEKELLIGNALIDMYSKFGFLGAAHRVLHKLEIQDVVSWNAFMVAFSQMGDIEGVCCFFNELLSEGLVPDMVTFSIILNAFNHVGMLNDAFTFACNYINNRLFVPSREHYICMVDAIGRAGQVNEAVLLVRMMPIQPCSLVWHSLLGSCQKWYNVELGRVVFEHVIQSDGNESVVFRLSDRS